MVENSRMSGVRSRKGGRGGQNNPSSNSRHLRSNKIPNSCNNNNSSSSNWKDFNKAGNTNESSNYGYNNHHLTSAFCSLVGLQVQIQKTDGKIYEGILETVSNKLDFHLSCAYCKSGEKDNHGGEVRVKNKIIFPFCDVVSCKSKSVDLSFAKRNVLMTDSAIAGCHAPNKQRELVQWEPNDTDGNFCSLEDLDNNEFWGFDDMVRVNEEQHGVKSTYDSSLNNYMTPIIKRDDEEYREKERKAEQMAREIQKDAMFIEHEKVDSGAGEEEIFSAVTRPSHNDGFSNTGQNFKNNRGGGRGGKHSNMVVGPRFQKGFRNHESSVYNRNTTGPLSNRVQNGTALRNNNNYQHHNHQQQHVLSDTATLNDAHVLPHVNDLQNSEGTAVNRPMSYSAAAMKKQQQKQQQQQFGHTLNKTSSQPLLPQPEMVNIAPLNSSQHPINISNEDLAAAKQQVIQNSKNYAAIASHCTPPKTTKPPSESFTNTLNLSSPQKAPLSGQQAHKFSQERKTEQNPLQAGDIKDRRSDDMKNCLVKYGKVNPTQSVDEEKKAIDVKKLREFGKGFKLSEKPQNTKKAMTKKSPMKPKVEEKGFPVVTFGQETESIRATSTSTSSTHVNTNAFSSTVEAVPITTVVKTTPVTTVSDVVFKSTLNPLVKEFSFNPAAKEFSPSQKSVVPKAQPFAVQIPSQPQGGYYQVPQHAPVIVNPSHDLVPHGQPKPFYRQTYPYNLSAGDMVNNGNPQLIGQPQGYVPHHQSMAPQQYIFVQGPPSGYQQVVPSGQYIQMQTASPMVRYIPASSIQHPRIASTVAYQQAENAPSNYAIGVNQHNLQQHQQAASQPHHSYPQPSPHMTATYVMNQPQNTGYPQIASPINHATAGGAPTFRPSTPIQTVPAQPNPHQQLLMMGHQQIPGVNMAPNHGYMQNAQHGGAMYTN